MQQQQQEGSNKRKRGEGETHEAEAEELEQVKDDDEEQQLAKRQKLLEVAKKEELNQILSRMRTMMVSVFPEEIWHHIFGYLFTLNFFYLIYIHTFRTEFFLSSCCVF